MRAFWKGASPLDNDCTQGQGLTPGLPVERVKAIEPPVVIKPRGLIQIIKPGFGALITHEGPLLVLVVIVISLSFAIPFLKSHSAWIGLPCWFYKITGIPCLACGLTRSFVFTAHGQWISALKMHLLGPPLFFLTCALGVYFTIALTYGIRLKVNISRKTRSVILWAALSILIAAWSIKIFLIPSSWK